MNKELEILLSENNIKTPWDFVEAFYKEYSQCVIVAEHNDLCKIIDNEDEDDSAARNMLIKNFGGDRENPEIQNTLDFQESELYARAIKGFIELMNPQKNVKIILASDDTGAYRVYEVNKHYDLTGDYLFEGTVDECFYVTEETENFKLINVDDVQEDMNINKKDDVEKILINQWSLLGMDIPENYEDIVQYVFEDVCNTADKKNWNDSDVMIGFRRWIESKS